MAVKKLIHLASDITSPIDDRPEDVEHESLDFRAIRHVVGLSSGEVKQV
jgi:hypothetical protein